MYHPQYSNCLLWALVMMYKHGGYIFFRRSRWGYFPHVMWSGDLREFWGYTPTDPKKQVCPPILFRGEPRREEPSERKQT